MKVSAIVILLVCSGCFITVESQRESQECNIDHSERIKENVKELRRISESSGMSQPVIDRLKDIDESATRIGNWSKLARADIGRAKAKPPIMTNEELARQGVYKDKIELKEKLTAAATGVFGSSNGIAGLVTGLATGGGGLAIALKLFGGKTKLIGQLTAQLTQAKAAVKESIALFREAPDNIRQMAADRPNLAKEYGEEREAQRARRIQNLEHGNEQA